MASNVSPAPATSKAWGISLWVVQVLVALGFGMAGFMKATAPLETLAANMTWVAAMPGLVRFIGVAELLGALGMILPAATRIRPMLTPAAGLGLVIIMVLAALFHLTRGEFSAIGANAILGLLAGFVAWGRLRKAPIAPRN